MVTTPTGMPAVDGVVADDTPRDLGASIHEGEPAEQAGIAGDPIDELVERVRPMAAQAVDALQVAASLEADGITDSMARARYGYDDVFTLAEEVRRRAGPAGSTAVPASKMGRRWGPALRDITHGLLYLLPAAVFPVVLAVLGRRSLVLGLVLAGGIGWVWAGSATWLAYRLLGRGYPGSAARVLCWSALAGLPVAAAASVAVAAMTDAGYGLIALSVGQMAYQMASALLVFYRCEPWLFAAMVPAVAGGTAYLVGGARLLPLAIGVGVGSVAVAFGIALSKTRGRQEHPEPPLADGLRGELGQFPMVVAYSTLSAVYLLSAQGRHLEDGFDVPIAAVPLIVGMGVVEWRAKRFVEQARVLLKCVRYPRQFVTRIWLLLAGNVAACLGVVALFAVVLLTALHAAHRLTAAGVVMTAASVLLAGAYFLAFLLAGMARYGWLCGSLAGCTAVHVALVSALLPKLSLLAQTTVFLGSVLVLLLLFLTALTGRLGQARYHR
jgi:hypothetical protein